MRYHEIVKNTLDKNYFTIPEKKPLEKWSVERSDRTIGDKDEITIQCYTVKGIPKLSAYLKVTNYGNLPDYPGRVISTIEIHPPEYQGRGFAQALYLAALKDGPIHERPEFRSGTAERVIERLISKRLVHREEHDGRMFLMLGAE